MVARSVKLEFTHDNVRKCQNEDLTVSMAVKKSGVSKSTFMKNLLEGLKIFGWKRQSGEELRLGHEKIELEVMLMKVDSNYTELEDECVVMLIDDSDLFEEAKEKMCSELGKGEYTLKFKRSNDEWVSINDGMDYEVCISHFKDIKRAAEATEAGKRDAAQRLAAKKKPYKRVMMEIYAQLMPSS